MHQLIDKKKKILIYLIFLIILSTTTNKSFKIQNNYSVMINKINVSGLSNDNNLKITKNLTTYYLQIYFLLMKKLLRKQYLNII